MVDAERRAREPRRGRAPAVDEAAATAGRARRLGGDPRRRQVRHRATTCRALAEAGIDAGRREPHRRAARQAGRLRATRFRWDFIGHLQSRKARDVVGRVELVHALSAESTRARRSTRAPSGRRTCWSRSTSPPTRPRRASRRPSSTRSWSCSPALERARRGPDDDAAVRRGSRGVAARVRRAARAGGRLDERWAGTHAFDVLSMGTQPGLRRGRGRGRDDRPPRQRALRRSSDAVTDPSSTLAPHGSS